MIPKLRSLVLAIAMLLVGAAGAHATTVAYSGDTVIVTGGDNAAHDIQFRLSTDGLSDQILDTVAFTTYPGDCTLETATKVVCPAHGNVKVDVGAGNDRIYFNSQGFDCFNSYELNLGDGANAVYLSDDCGATLTGPATATSGSGDDVLTAGSQPITFNAGGGKDSLYGSPGDDVLHGGDGPDRLFGRGGNDQVLGESDADQANGGAGNDLVDGGTGDDGLERCSDCIGTGDDPGIGADTYVGGAGTDTLWLDKHAPGVAVSLNGAADDGATGEGDNVGSDVESIEGTAGNDTFNGSPGADRFSGRSGDDEIHGGDGPDDLDGGGGADRVFGDAGNDKVQGSEDADTVDGGPGSDQIYGDIASCSVFCNVDPDTILARDGEPDTVDCGGGADTAQVDQVDVVAYCASVDRGSSGPGGGPSVGPGGSVATGSFRVTGKRSRAKGIQVTVTCPAACSFTVKLSIGSKVTRKVGLGRKTLTIGTVRGSLAAAGDRTVTLKLSARPLKKLKRLKNVAANLSVAFTDASGTTTTNQAVTTRR
jgi:Ca2+-binding RTX toxin-like protein